MGIETTKMKAFDYIKKREHQFEAMHGEKQTPFYIVNQRWDASSYVIPHRFDFETVDGLTNQKYVCTMVLYFDPIIEKYSTPYNDLYSWRLDAINGEKIEDMTFDNFVLKTMSLENKITRKIQVHITKNILKFIS